MKTLACLHREQLPLPPCRPSPHRWDQLQSAYSDVTLRTTLLTSEPRTTSADATNTDVSFLSATPGTICDYASRQSQELRRHTTVYRKLTTFVTPVQPPGDKLPHHKLTSTDRHYTQSTHSWGAIDQSPRLQSLTIAYITCSYIPSRQFVHYSSSSVLTIPQLILTYTFRRTFPNSIGI